MRLLNTTTFKLQEFLGDRIPKSGQTAEESLGWRKIRYYCYQVAQDGFSWVWIDTCCIDKTSSAELSESINSIFEWYKKSRICYAYLEECFQAQSFASSWWWSRGWTLQELIAPDVVEFHDSAWREIGSKLSLQEEITNITGIDRGMLTGGNLFDRNVAVRMSWAVKRQTTRVEDQAYCLLGLFGVNMPLLYGEGERAFLRLQEEIMEVREDYTLFVWRARTDEHTKYDRTPSGLLAESPTDFASWEDYPPAELNSWSMDAPFRRDFRRGPHFQSWAFTKLSRNCFSVFPPPNGHDAPFTTSRGLRITLPVYQPNFRSQNLWVCVTLLNEGSVDEQMACIPLFQLQPAQYAHSSRNILVFIPKSNRDCFEYRSIYIIKPRANIRTTNLPGTGTSPINLLVVDLKGQSSKQLYCYLATCVSVVDLLSLVSKSEDEYDISDRRLHKLARFFGLLQSQERMREDPAGQCLGRSPDLCWFLDNETVWPNIYSEEGQIVLGFGDKTYPYCAFMVLVGLNNEKALCNVIPTTTNVLQHVTNHKRLDWELREIHLLTDRIKVSLAPDSSTVGAPEFPSFEFDVSIRRVATSSLGVKRYILSIA